MTVNSPKHIVIFFVVTLMLLSVFGFTYAAKPEGAGSQGKGGGASSGAGQGSGSGGGHGADTGGPEGTPGEGPSTVAQAGIQGQGKGLDKSEEITVGELVSSVEKVKRDQWKITKDQLKELGYHGPVNDFVIAFNREINAQKAGIREKILNGSAELTKAVVNETAERELARIRDEEIANLNITEGDVTSTLTVLMGDEGDDAEQLVGALQKEISFMDEHFKKSVFYIATNGTEVEKTNLADQLNNLIA